MKGPIKPVHELYQEIENIQNELQDWKKAYEDLELEKERIYEEMVLAVNQKENETQVLQKTNKELEDYIASLENSVGISSYQGKPLSTVINKFKTLKTFIYYSVCRIENEGKIKFEFHVILAPSPLILILILSVMGSKSLFCFRKSEICILNTVSTEVTLAPSNLAFSGSILHILFSSSRHCLTK